MTTSRTTPDTRTGSPTSQPTPSSGDLRPRRARRGAAVAVAVLAILGGGTAAVAVATSDGSPATPVVVEDHTPRYGSADSLEHWASSEEATG